jgi:signal transduction histidine kinase
MSAKRDHRRKHQAIGKGSGARRITAPASEAEIVARTARAFAASGSDSSVPLELLSQVAEERWGGSCTTWLLSDDDRYFAIAAVHGRRESGVRSGAGAHTGWLRAENNVLARAARTGRAIVLNALEQAEQFAAAACLLDPDRDRFTPCSLICVPLNGRERPLGAVVVLSDRIQIVDERDADLLVELADLAGLSFEGASRAESRESSLRARDEVLAIVAHDLRNPIHLVSNCAAMLKECTADQSSLQQVLTICGRITRATAMMEGLTNKLLDSARIESRALHVRPAAVGAEELLERARELTAPAADEKGVNLELRSQRVRVFCDAMLIVDVCVNLIGNAVRFTPRGGRIVLDASEARKMVRFVISDNGVGIAPEHLDCIFDRYWRGKDDERARTGLGLYIAKGIVEAHGGTISVTSTLGAGTTFSFELWSAD